MANLIIRCGKRTITVLGVSPTRALHQDNVLTVARSAIRIKFALCTRLLGRVNRPRVAPFGKADAGRVRVAPEE
ncbi:MULTISPECIES: hypothetical protein [Moorena]|uniref:hypothetical protein n=1 Tax=Moorena TaxID=1155738 RepID=UPI0010560A6D|nr:MULTISPECIES: hypothetical protein [Moorena]NEQ16746.1 hypothetical protein [Moorena sp. SIO3E2]NER85490.1 hypothetical protein [Moorena sp. SIO3A2]NES45697.1 hypothetical protein [Moorena sp. SIO2C4]NET69102.1 hypothetical protein [Moorena sp. SIO1G6]